MLEYREKRFDTLGGHVAKAVDILRKDQFSGESEKSEKKVVCGYEM